ncbi:hypothetical protein MHYP_G00070370 [Metynnis hypsauchen]
MAGPPAGPLLVAIAALCRWPHVACVRSHHHQLRVALRMPIFDHEGAQEEFGVEAGPRRRLLRDLQCDLPDPAQRLSQTSTVSARLDLCLSIHYSDMRNGYTRRLQCMEHRGLQQVTCLPHSTSVLQAKMRADSEPLIKANQHQGVTAGLPEAPPCAV